MKTAEEMQKQKLSKLKNRLLPLMDFTDAQLQEFFSASESFLDAIRYDLLQLNTAQQRTALLKELPMDKRNPIPMIMSKQAEKLAWEKSLLDLLAKRVIPLLQLPDAGLRQVPNELIKTLNDAFKLLAPRQCEALLYHIPKQDIMRLPLLMLTAAEGDKWNKLVSSFIREFDTPSNVPVYVERHQKEKRETPVIQNPTPLNAPVPFEHDQKKKRETSVIQDPSAVEDQRQRLLHEKQALSILRQQLEIERLRITAEAHNERERLRLDRERMEQEKLSAEAERQRLETAQQDLQRILRVIATQSVQRIQNDLRREEQAHHAESKRLQEAATAELARQTEIKRQLEAEQARQQDQIRQLRINREQQEAAAQQAAARLAAEQAAARLAAEQAAARLTALQAAAQLAAEQAAAQRLAEEKAAAQLAAQKAAQLALQQAEVARIAAFQQVYLAQQQAQRCAAEAEAAATLATGRELGLH